VKYRGVSALTQIELLTGTTSFRFYDHRDLIFPLHALPP